ncbi:hypothetical protein B1729_15470 [Microbacterium sp. B35-04]|nr:hypothetical protein B1729_15470 [Microbacterium sp. B35-04]
MTAVARGPSGQTARLLPYRRRAVAGESAAYTVRMRNPLPQPARAGITPLLPLGWRSSGQEFEIVLGPGEESSVQLTVTVTEEW